MGSVRLVLALMVAFTHFWRPDLPNALAMHAIFAVRAFFVISGFYMAMVLYDRYEDRRIGDFYVSRLLKLLPIYWAVTAALFVAQYLLIDQDKFAAFTSTLTYWRMLDIPALSWPALSFIAASVGGLLGIDNSLWVAVDRLSGNLVVAAAATPSTIPVISLAPVPQAWTLGVEIMFYLVAPFIVRRSLPAIASLLAASIALRLVGEQMGMPSWPFGRALFPLELAFFLLGAIAYRMYRILPADLNWPTIVLASLISVAALIFLRYLAVKTSQNWTVDVVAYVTLAAGLPFLFLATRKSRVDSFLGDLSYPTYIVHGAIAAFLPSVAALGPRTWLWTAVSLSLAAAAVLHIFIAKPVDRIRERFGARSARHGVDDAPRPRFTAIFRRITRQA